MPCRSAAQFRDSGACSAWSSVGDDGCQKFSSEVNGPLAELLLQRTSHTDNTCFDVFRFGAPLYGDLPKTGNGVACSLPPPASVEFLCSKVRQRNRKLLKRLQNDKFAQQLLLQTQADATLGRMTPPTLLTETHQSAPLSLRFGVEQGAKIRGVDDLTASGVNPCCRPMERLSTEGIDRLFVICRDLVAFDCSVPLLWKADIDSAYRRIPIAKSHRWAARVAFACDGHVYTSEHIAMPFGAIGSVHAWDRIGEFLVRVGRRILFLPLLRYVDDYFSADRAACAMHAMLCFARLVRCLLGPCAVSERKLCCAAPLTVLGLDVCLSDVGARFTLHTDKRVKWSQRVQKALDSNQLSCGLASKLAGALSWAASNLFHRLGRALLRPLFEHARGHTQKVNTSLKLCLEWWLEVPSRPLASCSFWEQYVFTLRLSVVSCDLYEGVVLDSDLCELVPWERSDQQCVHLFCDARSVPPRIAAVLIIDGQQFYTDCAPSDAVMQFFKPRGDKQIMSLELLSIAFGLCTFGHMLSGRKVIVFSDNVGAENSAKRGSSKAWDHSCLVHSIWRRAALSKMSLWVERVPSESNIADLPSREEYGLLTKMAAQRVEPYLDDAFVHPSAWANLSLNGRLS